MHQEVDDPRALLDNGLADLQNLAEEAYWATRFAYGGAVGTILVGVLVLYFLLLVALRVPPGDPQSGWHLFLFFALLASGTLGLAVPLVIRVRRRFRPTIESTLAWGRRLWEVRSEGGGSSASAETRSAFEVLVEASAHTSEWRLMVEGRGRIRGPGFWYVFMYAALAVLLVIEPFLLGTPTDVWADVGIASFYFLAVGGYLVQGRRDRAKVDHVLAEWAARSDEIRLRMAEYLEGL
ncbi:MAG TPA: hypothetical protein VEM95_04550 [Thermoplasmata archaeon]|nr:hypothetical protein [Thermoplasmata archaeon]